MFDISKFRRDYSFTDQYSRQLQRLKQSKKETACIEKAVNIALKNLEDGARSFVIYGEPQSGKTEMMICLTARLLDAGHSFILHLLNDSVDLLGQNLGRFKASGLAPAAKNFSEILDPAVRVKGQTHVVFCKKNGHDLRKILEKIGRQPGIVIVDDEADYASPNAKINTGGQTKINELVAALLGTSGTYIGVTATPARLDLNNTFKNDSEHWVDFPPHTRYTGQDVFFPLEGAGDYRLTLLPDSGADPKHARHALFGFLTSVAYLNVYENSEEENYSFLVHTSGKKIDHKSDWHTIHASLDVLINQKTARFEAYVRDIWKIARERYPDADSDKITHYVLQNLPRNSLIVLNSERDWIDNSSAATQPRSLFTIIIGGNIVSRGVTLENLLSMFFTRDVKHKIQQDTYIQRARMFGSRGTYLKHFELTIPRNLYSDWHRCFMFHRLALSAIHEGLGSLVWLGDKRISAVANSSIDRSTVDLDRGEMSFALFPYALQIDKIAEQQISSTRKMAELAKLLSDAAFPLYLRRYIERTLVRGDASLAVHKSSDISGYSDAPGLDKEGIRRKQGFFGKSQLEPDKYPHAIHHLRVFHNGGQQARLLYKFIGSIQFISNMRKRQ